MWIISEYSVIQAQSLEAPPIGCQGDRFPHAINHAYK
jgi:hypothetical protein